jgi:hypothetical protein
MPDSNEHNFGVTFLVLIVICITGTYIFQRIISPRNKHYDGLLESAPQNNKQSINIAPQKPITKLTYNIFSTKSHNFRSTYGKNIFHKDYRVVVPTTTTHKELKHIAEKIISSESNNINSLRIGFYWPESDPTGFYTAGVATCDFINNTWRTDMTYSQSYSKSTPTTYSNALSLEKRKKIFWDLVLEEDRAGMDVNPRKSHEIVARRYGIPVSEVVKILDEAIRKGWPMPKDPLY